MRITFWGTRGSLPKPGPTTARYGGNTSCVEVSADGTIIVLDCGTGAHGLGQDLLSRTSAPSRGHLLISHTHWDHIQGIPFFAPLFSPSWEWDIYGPQGLWQGLRETLAGQMQHTYFPITLDQLGARIRYHDLVEGSFRIDDVRVTTQYLNHPALTLGYRLEAAGATLVYACDHEPNIPVLAGGNGELSGNDARHVTFLRDADAVIHDAQYLAEEYPPKAGWGHSTVEYVIRVCGDANVDKLFLTHHDPLRSDSALDDIAARATRLALGTAPELEVVVAMEGMRFDALPRHHSATQRTPAAGDGAARAANARVGTVVVYAHGQALREQLLEALELEAVPHALVAHDATELMKLMQQPVCLLVIQHATPFVDAPEIVRSVRSALGERDMQPHILIVTTDQRVAQRESALEADWLIAPFSPSYGRTKIRSALLRVACRWVRAGTPTDEERRLQALGELKLLDTRPEERFDRITRVAAAMFNVPIALVTLVDRNRQWFKSRVGMDAQETPRDASFCAHAVEAKADVIVPDTFLDERFADHPAVTGSGHIRFYAGAPLTLHDGQCIGALCIADRRPRDLRSSEVQVLHDLRDLVVAQLELARPARQAR